MVLATVRNIMTNSLTTQLSEKPRKIKPPNKKRKGDIRKFQKLLLNFALTANQIKKTLKNKVIMAAQIKNSGRIRLISNPVTIIKL